MKENTVQNTAIKINPVTLAAPFKTGFLFTLGMAVANIFIGLTVLSPLLFLFLFFK